MKPTTDVEALTAVLHKVREVDHDWSPGCCGAEPHDRLEAKDLVDGLKAINWLPPRPAVSLPQSAPKGAEAAERIQDLHDRHYAIWHLLCTRGARTDEELVEAYEAVGWMKTVPQSPSSIRSRRAELVRAGHIFDTGEKRPTKAGGMARVWAARDAQVRAA